MCGISGFIHSSPGSNAAKLEAVVMQMANALRHRGPDDGGAWVAANVGLAMGHRRLSILDLSAEGHQPMRSANGRYVLVTNGEIYNFRALRSELEEIGHPFRGHCDTEVMLAAFYEWGVEVALKRFVGMFAFALWDRQERVLHLGRDRLGEKPLYYGWSGEVFLFGSELKALRAHPQWRGDLNRQALPLFLRHNSIPAPYSIYQNIFKLLPGCVLSLALSHVKAKATPQPKPYWSMLAVAKAGMANPFTGTEAEAIARLDQLLREAVAQQMTADVPLGAFLSGGVDSSTIVALMQSQSARPVKTFSIGFEADRFNEAHYAKAVAGHLGTEHTELYVRPQELHDVIPQLPRIYDEPLSDSAQIPTFLLCKLARQQVTVSLSGDGGDELFGGYRHYHKIKQIWRSLRMSPKSVRKTFAWILAGLARQGLNSALANSYPAARFLGRLCNFSAVLPSSDLGGVYQTIRSECRDLEDWLIDPQAPVTGFDQLTGWDRLASSLRQMMFTDSTSFLPDDILVKVDRAAMAVALETRIPLLDPRVVEFSWQLPPSLLCKDGQSKWLLRQVLHRYVPPQLVDRPKKGFGPPMAEWLAGPLYEWAEELLSEHRLRQEGVFRAKTIRQKWQEHLAKKRNWAQPLWSVLVFQAWLEQQKALPTALPQREPESMTIIANA